MFSIKDLNDQQQQAVVTKDPQVLVLAGAGTGKTRVITHRVACLVKNNVRPDKILALTFTRRAAREMNERISADPEMRMLIGGELPWCGTFHAMAVKYLRYYSRERFTVMDESDCRAMLKTIITEEVIEDIKPAELNALFSYSRNLCVDVTENKERFGIILDDETLLSIYNAFYQRKRSAGLKDFDDLLTSWIELLQLSPPVKNFFEHVLVDEYQDTNPLQERILDELMKFSPNIMVVGDDAQSIYGFRGSAVENILHFPKKYNNATIIQLTQNYRSYQSILDVANTVWQHSEIGMKKHLTSDCGENYSRLPSISESHNEQIEADKVVASVERDYNENFTFKGQAVLFRSSFQSILLETKLRKANIPYKKFGGLSLAHGAHVKDYMAFLRTISSWRDESAWFRFLTLLPKIGPKTANAIFNTIKLNKITIDSNLTARQRAVIEPYIHLYEKGPEANPSEQDLPEIINSTVELFRPIALKKYDGAEERLRDIEAVISTIGDYETLQDFINDYNLGFDEEDNANDDFLTLSTVHSAKGCEWDKVMIMGLTDEGFPAAKSIKSGENEEELRLFYVALTRAKKVLELYYPKTIWMRTREGGYNRRVDPSRFITQTDILNTLEDKKGYGRSKNSGDYYYDYS